MNPVTIAGGGLAGLSLGIGLLRRGVPVDLHDAGAYPRHRVCGEFLCGLRQEDIEALGISDDLAGAVPNHTCAWFLRGRLLLRRSLPRPGLGLSRHRLDQLLAKRFSEYGGRLHLRSRLPHEPREGLVWAAGKPATSNSPWIGLKCHIADYPLDADLEMHLGRRAYAGLSRIENGHLNLCALFHKPPVTPSTTKDLAGLRAWLRQAGLGALEERLSHATGIPGTFTSIAGFVFGRQRANDDLLCLGDAHALIPPFTGNGMSMALESAREALDPIAAYCLGRAGWEETVSRVRAALARRFHQRLRWAAAIHGLLLHPAAAPALRSLAPALPFSLIFQKLRTA